MFQDLLNSDAAGLENLRTIAKKISGENPGVIRDEVDILSFECSLFAEMMHEKTRCQLGPVR